MMMMMMMMVTIYRMIIMESIVFILDLLKQSRRWLGENCYCYEFLNEFLSKHNGNSVQHVKERNAAKERNALPTFL